MESTAAGPASLDGPGPWPVIDLERFGSGDGRYFEFVLRAHGPRVLTWIESYCRDGDHRDDLFQQVWTRVYEQRGSFAGRGTFASWLSKVTSSVCISDKRAEEARGKLIRNLTRLRLSSLGGSPTTDPLTDLERRERGAQLRLALGRLSRRERQAVALRLEEERRADEVAEIMGVSAASVRSHTRHAIKRLRAVVEEADYDLTPSGAGI